VVICLERGAYLHTAQLMPLPLTVSCFSKIQIGFTFLVRLTRVVPVKGPLNGCVWGEVIATLARRGLEVSVKKARSKSKDNAKERVRYTNIY